MVMGGEFDQMGWQYSNIQEAKRGHWEIVDCVKAGRKPFVDFGERPFIEKWLEKRNDWNDEENPDQEQENA